MLLLRQHEAQDCCGAKTSACQSAAYLQSVSASVGTSREFYDKFEEITPFVVDWSLLSTPDQVNEVSISLDSFPYYCLSACVGSLSVFSPGNQNHKNDIWTEALPNTSADGRPLSKLYLSRPTLFQPPTPCCHDNLHHHPHHPHQYHLGYCTVCCHDGAFVDLKKKKKNGKKKKKGERGGEGGGESREVGWVV